MSQRSECCNFFFFFLKKKRKRVWRVLLLVGLSRIALMRMNVLTDWMMYESFYRLGSSKMLWMVFVDRNLTEPLTSRSISETGKLLTGHFQRFIIFTRDCFKFLGEAIPFFINQTASMDDSCVSKKTTFFLRHCEKPVCMRCTVTQFAREIVGLCSFRGLCVMEFELSHSNLVSRITEIRTL